MTRKDAALGWQGLASRLQSKLETLKIQLREKDRHLLGDLQDLDLRCQTICRLVEALSEAQKNMDERKDMGPQVGRLLAEVKGLRACTEDVVGPLERLLSSIHADPKSRARGKM